MAKTNPESPPEMADVPASPAVEAAFLAADAATRNPEFPGYEAVRELYESFLRVNRRVDDLAGMVEALKNELADIRRGAVSNG